MPDIRFEVLTVLVVLLPGFLAARLEQRLTVNPKQSDFGQDHRSLLYSFFGLPDIYRDFPFPLAGFAQRPKVGRDGHYSIEANPIRLAFLPLIAVVLSILVSFAANNDFFGRFFRLLRVTRRTWRSSTWAGCFS